MKWRFGFRQTKINLTLLFLFAGCKLFAQDPALPLGQVTTGSGLYGGLKMCPKVCSTSVGDFYVSPTDESNSIPWLRITNSSTLGYYIQDGLANTKALMKSFYGIDLKTTIPSTSGSVTPVGAVEYCFLKNYSGGSLIAGTTATNMWYCPSEHENMLLYRYSVSKADNFGAVFSGNYWCSNDCSEYGRTREAFTLDFSGGLTIKQPKNASFKVRCIRRISAYLPSISTTEVSNISYSSATSGAYDIYDGGSAITDRGVCWNTDGGPTIVDARTRNGVGYDDFTSTLSGLLPCTTYYVRAYAVNSLGVNYGREKSFTTPQIETTAVPANSSLCTGSTTTISLSPSVPGSPSYQWQKSSDGTTWTNSGGGRGSKTATYTTPTLTAATAPVIYYYRAMVTGCCCPVKYSAAAAITVYPPSVAGSVGASATSICPNNAVTLTLTGYVGSIQWQQSTGGAMSNITGATGSTYVTPLLTQSTTYQAVVTSGPCASAISTPVVITVNPPAVGGTATPDASTVCTNTSTTVRLTGSTGTIQWQQSSDNVSWSSVSGGSGATTIAYTTPNLSSKMYYRAYVTNGSCTAYSTATTVDVVAPTNSGTVVPSATTVCEGSTVNFTLSGSTGTIQWQQYNGSTWAPATGSSAASTYTTPALTATTRYRVQTTNGICSPTTSGEVTITVTPSVGTPSFTNGPTSVSIAATPTSTYAATATNNTGISYSISDNTVGTINTVTGVVSWIKAGVVTITATATGCSGPKTATRIVTTSP